MLPGSIADVRAGRAADAERTQTSVRTREMRLIRSSRARTACGTGCAEDAGDAATAVRTEGMLRATDNRFKTNKIIQWLYSVE